MTGTFNTLQDAGGPAEPETSLLLSEGTARP